jgi:hypothetical protein
MKSNLKEIFGRESIRKKDIQFTKNFIYGRGPATVCSSFCTVARPNKWDCRSLPRQKPLPNIFAHPPPHPLHSRFVFRGVLSVTNLLNSRHGKTLVELHSTVQYSRFRILSLFYILQTQLVKKALKSMPLSTVVVPVPI